MSQMQMVPASAGPILALGRSEEILMRRECTDWPSVRSCWHLLLSSWLLVSCCSSSGLNKAIDASSTPAPVDLGQTQSISNRPTLAATLGTPPAAAAAQMQNTTASELRCDPNGAPNTCYQTGSSCNLVVLTCQRCCYDGNGYSKGESSCVCGACFGWTTP